MLRCNDILLQRNTWYDFNEIDKNRDGYITQQDLEAIIGLPMGSATSDAVWLAFVDGKDTNGDNRLTFEELYTSQR